MPHAANPWSYRPGISDPIPATRLFDDSILADQLVAELLDARLVAVFATLDSGGTIHAVPMWFAADETSILLATSSRSRKVGALEADSRSTLVIHDSRPGFEVCGVSIVGQAEIVRGAEADPLVRRVHRRYVDDDGEVPRVRRRRPALSSAVRPHLGPARHRGEHRAASIRWRPAAPAHRPAELAFAPMVAAMATLRGPVSALADISRLAGENVGPWLREYEGYRGTLVFTDEETETSRLITLWETPEDEERARSSRGAMRDQLAATAGMEVVSFEVFEVPAYELIPDADGDRSAVG